MKSARVGGTDTMGDNMTKEQVMHLIFIAVFFILVGIGILVWPVLMVLGKVQPPSVVEFILVGIGGTLLALFFADRD